MLQQMNKLGISLMIGYVLLVGVAIVMGGVMYTWMKSYIPQEDIACPEGVSLIINNYFYDCINKTLNLTLENNGRFDIAGYYIKVTDNINESLATIDISTKVINTGGGLYKYSNAVLFGGTNKNTFSPNNETQNLFDVSSINDGVKRVEIIPVRWQKENNKLRFVGCTETTKFKETLTCSN
jgi:hypothetical protein